MVTRVLALQVAALGASTLWASSLMAQPAPATQSQPAHNHSHAEVTTPTNFSAALRAISDHMADLARELGGQNLDAAHEHSDAINSLAKSLGALAFKPDSGVPKEKIKEINKAGKALADACDEVHDASEKHDIGAANLAHARMKERHALLVALAPDDAVALAATYACPMHCEGDKTYSKPGNCPDCNMHLKLQTPATYSASVVATGGKLLAGKPASLVFTLKDPAGTPVAALETVHEKVLHLLIVSKDLAWFAHEHPTLQKDGTFTLDFTFPAGGEFMLYNDFTPPKVGQQVVRVPLNVEGKPAPLMPLTPDAQAPKTIDGYAVALDASGPIKTGGETVLSFLISKDGQPVTTLATYLGAFGHLVVISEDGTQFVHSHPHDDGQAHATGGPKVDFAAHFNQPGLYKAWGQFNVGSREHERVITVPFTFVVAKGEAQGEPPTHHHDHK